MLQVGMGMGAWSSDKVSSYNLDNPPMRDTTTVLFSGTTEDKAAWVAFRYEASLSTSVNICQRLSTYGVPLSMCLDS